jgi:hypothetical protein
MNKLRESARGQDCMIRLPSVCTHDPDTTVLAHFRMMGDGMGRKPVDSRGAFACSACHDAVDSRMAIEGMNRGEVRLAHAEGVFRTQDWWITHGMM